MSMDKDDRVLLTIGAMTMLLLMVIGGFMIWAKVRMAEIDAGQRVAAPEVPK